MTYQVYARKLRPPQFAALVGQEHVVRALAHALDAGRLHHAYLFTGTRGVGKTTIARIFAKCLNCERGVSSTPCGECSACREIAEGRFVDLIEVDAASRTKVEDTRDLLDNVQYLPTRGRFKIYLIDEVHMLSGHSFNALLKTLEEPPEHVKFLLATTDPRKVPVTVLSRCLQFQLKNLLPERIASYLAEVLTAESIPYEAEALELVARAGRGSMRDALSILDQAVAFGGGKVGTRDVGDMLGSVERGELEPVLDALARADGAALLELAAAFAERAVDFREVLSALLGTLHDIAVAQVVPDRRAAALVTRYASTFDAETVQLLYQIVALGLRDFALAPDPRVAFEMTLLRALAFEPEPPPAASSGAGDPSRVAANTVPKRENRSIESRARTPRSSAPPAASVRKVPAATAATDWYAVVAGLPLGGVARMLAEHSVLVAQDDSRWTLCLDADHDTLNGENARTAIERALSAYAGRPLELVIEVGRAEGETPATRRARENRERHERAVAALRADGDVQSLLEEFGGELSIESVRPLNRT
jgi:DNA polymerase-3 subunit gamma/tau